MRENESPSRAFNPLYIGLWEVLCEYVRDISDSMIFRVQVIGKSQSSMVRVSSVRKALPLPSRAPSARSGRGVRFLRSMPLLPSRYLFETFGLPLKHLLELFLQKKFGILSEYFRLLREYCNCNSVPSITNYFKRWAIWIEKLANKYCGGDRLPKVITDPSPDCQINNRQLSCKQTFTICTIRYPFDIFK